jgi:hypothetical protein
LILPVRQQISFTDFRGALRFALQSLQGEPTAGRSLRILFLLTDAEPWPATGALNPEGKDRYFGDDKEAHPGNLAAFKRSLSESAIDLYVVALDDRPDDALHWSSLLPSGHYLSNRTHGDLDDAIRRILLGLLDPSCGQPTVAETAPPDIRTDLPDAAPQPSTAFAASGLRRPWYEITIALAGILFGTAISRAFSNRAINIANRVPPPTTEHEVTQEDADVEELRRRGRKVAPTDPGKAKEFFERALEKTEQFAQEGQELAAVQIPAIFREILTTIYREDLLAQREYIYQQAGIKSSRERARGLAPVLVERWSVTPELMMEEFFALQHHARVDEILQALAEFEPPGDWPPERLTLINVLRGLATAADDLQKIAEFYNG